MTDSDGVSGSDVREWLLGYSAHRETMESKRVDANKMKALEGLTHWVQIEEYLVLVAGPVYDALFDIYKLHPGRLIHYPNVSRAATSPFGLPPSTAQQVLDTSVARDVEFAVCNICLDRGSFIGFVVNDESKPIPTESRETVGLRVRRIL